VVQERNALGLRTGHACGIRLRLLAATPWQIDIADAWIAEERCHRGGGFIAASITDDQQPPVRHGLQQNRLDRTGERSGAAIGGQHYRDSGFQVNPRGAWYGFLSVSFDPGQCNGMKTPGAMPGIPRAGEAPETLRLGAQERLVQGPAWTA